MHSSRKDFIKQLGLLGLGAMAGREVLTGMPGCNSSKPFFEISLAEWSLHKSLFARKMTNLDFPRIAKTVYGISVVEYVNTFFKDKAENTGYLDELMKICRDNGVRNHLIMCDGEGSLADTDDKKRKEAVENHYKWVYAARHLGCSTIRVNAYGEGAAPVVHTAAVDGLGRLGEYAAKEKINVIVENHGGYSSDGGWLSGVMKEINRSNVGTLPDFGNFCLKRNVSNWKICEQEYDRYKGTTELMPFAKGVSAKTYDFDAAGNCIETDYYRMLRIVKEAGFKGYIGIEYEGNNLSEEEGIKKTKALLEKVAAALS